MIYLASYLLGGLITACFVVIIPDWRNETVDTVDFMGKCLVCLVGFPLLLVGVLVVVLAIRGIQLVDRLRFGIKKG